MLIQEITRSYQICLLVASNSLNHKGNWIDNYHTGYILDCLDEYQNLTGDKTWMDNIKLGYEFYDPKFFIDDFDKYL